MFLNLVGSWTYTVALPTTSIALLVGNPYFCRRWTFCLSFGLHENVDTLIYEALTLQRTTDRRIHRHFTA